jgi:hypothetical protein
MLPLVDNPRLEATNPFREEVFDEAAAFREGSRPIRSAPDFCEAWFLIAELTGEALEGP